MYGRLGKYRTKLHIVLVYITTSFFRVHRLKFLVGVSISNSQKLIE